MSEMSVIDNIRLTFLYIEFYSMGKTWVYPESYIPYNIFRYIVKGKAEFCIDGEEIIVKENQIVYIPQGCRMSCRALSESFEFYSLRFTTSVFYEGEDVLKEYYGIPRIIENEGEDYYFKEICKWVKKDSWVKKCFVRGYLDLLIGTLSMRVNKFDKNTGKVTEKNENPVLKIAKRKEQIDSRVQLVADYVVLHPREKYTPQKMAEMVELSKQRFSSLFKANMGKSPMEYVREIRLTTAARALLVSNKNIMATRFLNFYVRSGGGSLLTDDLKANLTSDLAIDGINYWLDIYKNCSPKDSVNYAVLDQANLFYQGKTAFDFNSGFQISGVETNSPDLVDQIDCAPLPKINADDPDYGAETSNIPMVVWKNSKHPEICKAFMKKLYEKDTYIKFLDATPVGMLPSISGISDTPEYKENETVQKFSNAVDVISDAMDKGTAIGYEHGPSVQAGLLTSQGIIESMFQDIITNGTDVKKAAKKAENQLNDLFSTVQ